jgi:hypothetical protein
MRGALRNPDRRKRESGLIEILAVMIVLIIALLLAASLQFTRASYNLAETGDRIRQTSVDRISLESAVRDSLLAKLEVSPANSASSLDSLLDSWCAAHNATAKGITLNRNGATPSIVGLAPAMFPSSTLPAIGTPNLVTAGDTFLTKDFIARGSVANGSPLSFSFTKTVSANTAENRTYSVSAQLWSVSMSNWALITYGLPGRGAVPMTAPSSLTTLLGSVSFTGGGGRAGLLTTLRPNPPYGNGDSTAFNQLYKPPTSGAERLPPYYTPHKSVFWNAWEFIWAGGNWPLSSYNAGYYQDRLLYYASQSTRSTGAVRTTTAITDLSAFSPPAQTGVTITGSSCTVNLGSYPEDILYIVDGVGGSTVNFSGAASNALGPLVVVVFSPATAKTVVNLSGTNSRSVLVYTRNCAVSFAAGTVFNGGVYLDMNSTATGGAATLNGVFAFYAGASAANPFPSLNLTLVPPTATLLTDLRNITPRALLVATTSAQN